LSSPAATTATRRRQPPHMMLVFSWFSPKKVPFEDTTEAVVVLAVGVNGNGEWRWNGGTVVGGGVGGVVGGFWSTRTRPYFSLICSHSFFYIVFYSSTKIR